MSSQNTLCHVCVVDGHDICWDIQPDSNCSCCIQTASQHHWRDKDWHAPFHHRNGKPCKE